MWFGMTTTCAVVDTCCTKSSTGMKNTFINSTTKEGRIFQSYQFNKMQFRALILQTTIMGIIFKQNQLDLGVLDYH
jgi:hypothetical protein